MAESSSGWNEEKKRLLRSWITFLEKGNSRRKLGQVLEAAEEYNKVVKEMRINVSEEVSIFSEEEKQARRELHQQTVRLKDFTLQENHTIDHIIQILQSMQAGKETNSITMTQLSSHHLIIVVNRIGIKNPQELFQPYISITTRSIEGNPLEESYETSYSSKFDKNYIIFNSEPITMKTPICHLPTDAAIFFELRHYKPSKRKISVKCFSFMEQDEFTVGQVALELYKKPTDVTRKNLKLLSYRKLYLYLTLSYTN